MIENWDPLINELLKNGENHVWYRENPISAMVGYRTRRKWGRTDNCLRHRRSHLQHSVDGPHQLAILNRHIIFTQIKTRIDIFIYLFKT